MGLLNFVLLWLCTMKSCCIWVIHLPIILHFIRLLPLSQCLWHWNNDRRCIKLTGNNYNKHKGSTYICHEIPWSHCDGIWQYRASSPLAEIMACFRTAPIHYLNPMQFYHQMCSHALTREQFSGKYSCDQSVKWVWKSYCYNYFRTSHGPTSWYIRWLIAPHRKPWAQ